MLPKLKSDFGVTALLATIVLVGSFALLIIGLVTSKITMGDLLPMIGAWVGSIVTAFFVVKGIKTDKGG